MSASTVEVPEIDEEQKCDNRKRFALFLLEHAGLDEIEIEDFWYERKAAFRNRSPHDLFESGKYAEGLLSVYRYLDELEEKCQ